MKVLIDNDWFHNIQRELILYVKKFGERIIIREARPWIESIISNNCDCKKVVPGIKSMDNESKWKDDWIKTSR